MKMLNSMSVVLGAAMLCLTPASLHWSPQNSLSVSLDTAQARIGRPLTPMSVAGVHRRAYRRAYRHGYGYYGYGARVYRPYAYGRYY